jgi:hypothetical protein
MRPRKLIIRFLVSASPALVYRFNHYIVSAVATDDWPKLSAPKTITKDNFVIDIFMYFLYEN